MQDVTVTLEACPWCGEEGRLETFLKEGNGHNWHRVECTQCGARGPEVMGCSLNYYGAHLHREREAEAIAAWNARLAHSGAVDVEAAQIESLTEALLHAREGFEHLRLTLPGIQLEQRALAASIAARHVQHIDAALMLSTPTVLPSPVEREAFIEAIHAATPLGEYVEVQHHPNGDWSVGKIALPSPVGRGEIVEEAAVDPRLDPDLMTITVSLVDGTIGIDHATDANWQAIFDAHVAVRERMDERITAEGDCPVKPSPPRALQPAAPEGEGHDR